MVRQRKNSEERKKEIVETALELMAERGAGKVTAQAIADRIGIAQPTVFRHFRTRDAIFRSALKFVANQVMGLLETTAASDKRADQRLHDLLTRQLSVVSRNKGLPRMLFSDRLHLENPALKVTVRSVMERYVSHVQRMIEEGQAEGSFDQGLDARKSAEFLAATVQGLLLRWSIYDFEFALERESESLWRFIHAALKPEKDTNAVISDEHPTPQ